MGLNNDGVVSIVNDGVLRICRSPARNSHNRPAMQAGVGNTRIVVVTGENRGGTSMVASVCHHLGIPMGRGGPRYENPFLQKAVLAERWDIVEVLVAILSEVYPLWGWKLPALMTQMSHLEKLSADVRVIIIFKDPISIGCRRIKNKPNKDPLGMLLSSMPRYIKALEFVRNTPLSCLLVSYEKAQLDLPGFSSAMAEYCGVQLPDVSEVIKKIHQDAIKYNNPSLRKDLANLEDEAQKKMGGMSVELQRKLKRTCVEMGLDL